MDIINVNPVIVEECYIKAVQNREAGSKPSGEYWQGAIEVMEELMERSRSMWAFDTLKSHGLLNTVTAETMGSDHA